MAEMAEYIKAFWNNGRQVRPVKDWPSWPLAIPVAGARWTTTAISQGPGTFYPEIKRPKTNCRNCGAANHEIQCEYCGTLT